MSFALTSFFARLSVLLRLRQGLGSWFISWPLGLRIFLSGVVFRFGVELTFRKVSYGVALFSLFCWKSLPLFRKGTCWRA